MNNIQVNFGKQRKTSSVLIVDYFENCPPQFGGRFAENDPFYKLVAPAFATGDFNGLWKQNVLLYTYGSIPEARILLVGLGPQQQMSPFKIKIAFAYALKGLQRYNIKEVSTFIDKKCCPNEFREIGEFLAEAAYLSQYRHPSYKKNPPEQPNLVEQIYLLLPEDADETSIAEGINEGRLIGGVVNEVRDLINKPANYMTPSLLANHAKKLERDHSRISCQVFKKEEIASMGMGGLLGVAKGSQESPCFITCCYTPEAVAEKCQTVALVGKGVTFDAGGISLKEGKGMFRMKDDMAGAALVLGIIKLAAQMQLPIKILGLIPSCENLPDGSALKPGDIITAYDGTTVEVYDTDAEGRLILMDALGYAVAQQADVIVDLATLTGACTIALGRYVIGGMTNCQPVMQIMRQSGDAIYERVWQFPLMEEYKLPLRSMFADLKNYGGREAGAIVAGAFLSHFVQNKPWIHLDIAGVSWFDSETSLIPEGASGIGVRLLIDFLKRLCEAKDLDIWKTGTTSIAGPTFKEDEVPTDHSIPPIHRKYFI